MIRGLKLFLPALIAVFIVNAAAASIAAAQSQGWLTADNYPARLTGTDTINERSKLKALGQEVLCHGHYGAGKENETEEFEPGKFRHKEVSEKLKTLTVEPTYTNCEGIIGATKAPATVTMNGCDYLLHLGLTVSAGVWAVTADLVCPAGKDIEIHAYTSTAHSSSICTVTIKPQTGLEGGTAQNVLENGRWKVTLQGPFKKIHAERSGVLCGGAATTTEGELFIHAILSGTNKNNEATDITITE